MDWSKASNILIALFLAVDLALGFVYVSQRQEAKLAAHQAAEDTAVYMQSKGASVNCVIPEETQRMAVLFVRIERAAGNAQPEGTYLNYRLVMTGSPDYTVKAIEPGDARAEIISASRALQKFAAQYADTSMLSGLKISGVDLVYWVDRSFVQDGEGEDTAQPSWEISTNRGVFYINAL